MRAALIALLLAAPPMPRPQTRPQPASPGPGSTTACSNGTRASSSSPLRPVLPPASTGHSPTLRPPPDPLPEPAAMTPLQERLAAQTEQGRLGLPADGWTTPALLEAP